MLGCQESVCRQHYTLSVERGTCPLLSSTAAAWDISIQYIFMQFSLLNCTPSPTAHFPVIVTNSLSSSLVSPGVPHGLLSIHSTVAENNINRSQGRHSHWPCVVCVCVFVIMSQNVWTTEAGKREFERDVNKTKWCDERFECIRSVARVIAAQNKWNYFLCALPINYFHM